MKYSYNDWMIMEKYGWLNPWTSIEVSCSWCSAKQTVTTASNKCFYCSKVFFVGVDGKVTK